MVTPGTATPKWAINSMLGQIIALWSVGLVLGIMMLSGMNCYTTNEELGIKGVDKPNMDEEAPLMGMGEGMAEGMGE